MTHPRSCARLLLPALAGCLGASLVARADVTIQQQATFDLSLIKAHSNTTELTSGDKQRRDTDLHCEGFMSLLCGNSQGGEIVRLDKEVQWTLEPKKRQYRESHFLSAAERQAAEAQASAALEKLKQCPTPPQAANQAPDTSKCEMTPPKIDVHQTDRHASLAGHDSHLTQLVLTQSCRDKTTSDTCDFTLTLDSWLTQEEIAGVADVTAFRTAYLKKLGFDDPNSQMLKEVRQFLAPYQDSLKQLSSRATEFKGYPLKTDIRIAFGGAQCAAAKKGAPGGANGNAVTDASQAASDAATSSASGAAGAAAGQAASNAAGNSIGGSILGSAASAFGSKLAGGLFAKKTPSTPAPAAPSPEVPPNMIQVAQITLQTSAITPGPVPAEQFEIPAGWKLVTPKEKAPKEFTCPNPGT